MAEKETQKVEERLYTIPLRPEWRKGPKIKRAGRAADAVRKYLARHAKAGEVKISGKLNMQIWSRGLKNPPPKIRVKAIEKDGIVTAMLPDEEIAKEEEKGRMNKLRDRLSGTSKLGEKMAEKLPEDAGAEKPTAEAEEKPSAWEKPKSEKKPAKTRKLKDDKPKEQN